MAFVNGWLSRRYASTAAIQGLDGASEFVGFPLTAFEYGFLWGVAKSLVPKETNDPYTERFDSIEARLSELDATAKEIEDAALSEGASGATVAVKMLARIETQRNELKAEKEELKERKANGTGSEAYADLSTFAERQVKLTEKVSSAAMTERRLRTRTAIRRLFERIDCKLSRKGKSVFFAETVAKLVGGGEHRMVIKCKVIRHDNRIAIWHGREMEQWWDDEPTLMKNYVPTLE